MKKLLLVLAFISVSFGFAQTEEPNYKNMVSEFTYNFNNGDIVSIYNMFNENFQKTLTLEKTKTFFKTNVNREVTGNIKSFELKQVIRTGHNYKVTFANSSTEAFFLLDENNKISGLQIYPPKQ